MKLLENKREKLQAASLSITAILFDNGYIDETTRIWLRDRIQRGDKSAYDDLRELLLQMADELGRK